MNRFELYSWNKVMTEYNEVKKKKDELNTAAEEVAEPSSESKSEKSVSEPFTIYFTPLARSPYNPKDDPKYNFTFQYCRYSYYSFY